MGILDKAGDIIKAGVDKATEAAEAARSKAGQPPVPQQDTAPQAPAPKAPAPEAPAAQKKAPAPKKPAAPKHRTVTVVAGDTLSEIAAKHGVDWREMAKLNKLENPDLIFPGQVFKLPNK